MTTFVWAAIFAVVGVWLLIMELRIQKIQERNDLRDQAHAIRRKVSV